MDVHKILVGIDGSQRTLQVLAAAEEFGVRFGAQLVLARVIGIPPEIPPEAWQHSGTDLLSFLEQGARRELDAALQTLPEALRQKTRLETMVATPWQGLCALAECHAVDLIIIGSHGYSGLDRILGTTAARVVNHASCSVFIVRATLPAHNITSSDSR